MKELETRVEKTEFGVEVIGMDTKDEKYIKPLGPSSNDRKFTVHLDYHLTCNRIKRKVVPS